MNISIKKRFNSIKLPARASLFYIGAGAVGKLTGVLFTPLFTRILSGEEYGEYARYLSIVGVASVIGSSLTSSSAIYKGLEEKTTQSKDYLKSVLVINLAFSLVFCLLLFTFNRFLGVKLSFLIPISLQIFADGITAVYLTGAKFKYKYLPVTAILLIGSLIPPILSAFIISRVGKGFIVRTYCLLTVSIITASFSLIKIWCDGKVSLSLVKNAFRSTMPLIPHGLSNAVSSQADKLILASVMGANRLLNILLYFRLVWHYNLPLLR